MRALGFECCGRTMRPVGFLLIVLLWPALALAQEDKKPTSPEEVFKAVKAIVDTDRRKEFTHKNVSAMFKDGHPWFPGFRGSIAKTIEPMQQIGKHEHK